MATFSMFISAMFVFGTVLRWRLAVRIMAASGKTLSSMAAMYSHSRPGEPVRSRAI